MPNTIAPFGHPLYVMLKPVGAACNLRCEYCYYLEKQNLYDKAERHVMTEEMLERFTREYIEAQTMPQVLFTWHGGEPLMRPLSFYKKALELQRKYARGRQISNVIQTNGTLLTDEWCDFLAENHWLVGISIDGPQEFHDEYRRTQTNKPSWLKVMNGIKLLKKHGVEWNAMAVVNDFNADYPLDFYHFFKDNGCQFSQLKHASLPRQCVECEFEFACHGECPKNRFARDKYGNPGLNYLCEGYHKFLEHVTPYMDFMKRELDNQRPPANIMEAVRKGYFR